MKKTLIALAAVAAATGALAQNVTLSGTYSVSYQKDLTGTKPGSSSSTSAGGSEAAGAAAKGLAVTDASVNFAVSEDLGGGLRAAASMLWESGFHRGAAITRADSSASLSGGFGTVAFRNTRSSDLIAGIMSSAVNLPDGLYDSTHVLSRSAIDTLSFTTAELAPGLRASMTYIEMNDGNQDKPAKNGSTYVLGASYVSGPLTVGFAYKMPQSPEAVAADLTGNKLVTANTFGLKPKNNAELSIAYNAGFATVAYAYDAPIFEKGTATDISAVTAGAETIKAAASREGAINGTKAANGIAVTVPVGAVTLGLNYAKRGNQTYTGFGATYALSKRTSITVASGQKSIKNSDAATQTALRNAATGLHGSQYRVALRHTF